MEVIEHNKNTKKLKNVVNKSTEDNKVKILAHYLEKGYTMLASHCQYCNSPMFRYHGEIFCPLCSNSIIKDDNNKNIVEKLEVNNIKDDSKNLIKTKNPDYYNSYNIKNIINRINMKLFFIIENQLNIIENKKNNNEINNHLQIINSCIQIIQNLKTN